MWTERQRPYAQFDPELNAAIQAERARQEAHIELIASENYASPARDGSAGHRADQQVRRGLSRQALLRRLRVRRRRRDSWRSSASRSCSAATSPTCSRIPARRPTPRCSWRWCNPGDTVMGMNLAQGGHLTHGNPANFSGKHYKIVPYGLDPATGYINYDEMERIARRDQAEDADRRLLRVLARSRTGRACARSPTRSARMFWVDMAHVAGLVAAGEYPSPLPHAHVVTSTTHKTLRGPRGGIILARGRARTSTRSSTRRCSPASRAGR